MAVSFWFSEDCKLKKDRMKKIAIYVRVSTTEQTTENQLIKLKQYCRDRKLQYEVFEETESSRKSRPIKQGNVPEYHLSST